MTSITFEGVSIRCYQTADYSIDIQSRQTRLYSGKMYVNLSTTTSIFPRRFTCYTLAYSEISALIALVGTFGSLVIDGTTYTDCYISEISGVKELIEGTGKYTYSIAFSRADQH